MFATQLKCVKCGKIHEIKPEYYNCAACGNVLDVQYDYEKLKDEIDPRRIFRREVRSVWKYKELLPVRDSSMLVSLGEGGTPLYRCSKLGRVLGIAHLYVKDETRNPTNSFKDRPIAVAISKAKEFGVTMVTSSSSGNAGASLSAYAAKAELGCHIFVPCETPHSKVAQIMMYGANVVAVKGTCSDAFKLAKIATRKYGWFNVTSTFLNPYATEGDKTLGYEIFEQLGKQPDWIIIPIGVGALLVGSWKAFEELNKLDVLHGLPSMVGVQAEGCSPIAKAFQQGKANVEEWGKPKTVASAIADPLWGYAQDGTYALETIRESKGLGEACTDREILEAMKVLAKTESVFAEPAGGASVAGLKILIEAGKIDRTDAVVCVVTGHGLKDAATARRLCGKPPEILPTASELKRLFKMNLDSRSASCQDESFFN